MKLLIKLFLFSFVFISLPVYAASSPNYINEMTHYAVWKNANRITVWVQPNTMYTSTVYDAFREWMVAGGGCLRFVDANNEKYANIRVYFVENLSGNQVGLTQHYSAGKYMTRANIQIRYKRLNSKQTISKREAYAIAVHEIGHALGIMGHSSNRNDIMYPDTSVIGIHASNRDFNTIREFYCSGKY